MTTTHEVCSPGAARRGFKVSLRTLLLSLLAIGAGTGLLGRLFLTKPQVAMIILSVLSTIVPFVLAIGTIFWIGARGRRWGLVLWAGCLILIPPVGTALLYFAQRSGRRSPADLAVQNTQLLLEERLPQQIDQPQVWDELERRIQSKSLTAEQADEAIGLFAAHMKKTRPGGWNQPLHWQDDFIESATKAGLVSDPVRYEFLDAFYGPKPVIRPLHRVRANGSGFAIQIHYGNTWAAHSGIDTTLLWDVKRVLLDGKPVEVKRKQRGGQTWSGRYEGELQVGEATVAVEVEAIYVHQDKLIGLNASNLPLKSWPKADKHWKQTVSAPLRVYSADEPIVALCTDPAFDPQQANAISIKRFVAQPDPKGGTRLVVQFEFTQALSIALSSDVSVRAGDQTFPIGSQFCLHPEGMSNGDTVQRRIESLAPGIGVCDIILEPNPQHIERYPQAEEIWGRTITLRNVPLERLDLDAEQAAGQP